MSKLWTCSIRDRLLANAFEALVQSWGNDQKGLEARASSHNESIIDRQHLLRQLTSAISIKLEKRLGTHDPTPLEPTVARLWFWHLWRHSFGAMRVNSPRQLPG